MENQSDNHIEIPVLGIEISAKFAQEILDEVMRVYPGRGNPAFETLHQAVRACVQIPGFRAGKAHKAPVHQLKNSLESSWFRVPPLALAMVEVWCSLREELVNVCDRWLDSNGVYLNFSIKETDEEQEQSSENPSLQQLSHEFANNFLDEHPDYKSLEEVELILHTRIFNRVKINGEPPDKPNEDGEQQLSQAWADVLETLRQIPAEDEKWSAIDQFLAAVLEMADEKHQERERTIKTGELAQVLADCLPIISQWAQYFEVENVSAWSLTQVAIEDEEVVQTSLKRLVDELTAFDLLDQRKATTLAERKQLEKDRSRAEEKILVLYQDLGSRLLDNEAMPVEEEKPVEQVDTAEETPLDIEEPSVEVVTEGQQDQIATDEAEIEVQEDLPAPQENVEPPDEIQDDHIPILVEDQGGDLEQTTTLTGELETSPAAQSEAGQSEREAPEPDQPMQEAQADPVPVGELESPAGEDATSAALETDPVFDLADVHQAIVCALGDGNLPKAYWLAWGLEKQDKPSNIPSWLIAAAQGVIWQIGLWPDQPAEYVESLHNLLQLSQRHIDSQNQTELYLGMAAGPFMSMAALGRGWEELWHPLHNLQPASLGQFVEIVKEANSKGLRLDPNLVQLVVNKGQMEQWISQYSNQAKVWLEKSKNRGISLFRAQQVWLELINSQRGELYKFLEPVVSDQRGKVDQVLDEAKGKWRNRNWMEKTIQRLDQGLTKNKKKRPIVGDSRDQILNSVWDACEIAENWANTILESKPGSDKGKNWLSSQTKEFCEAASKSLEQVIQDLEMPDESTGDLAVVAARKVLLRVLDGFYALVSPNRQVNRADFPHLPLFKDAIGPWERTHFEQNLVVPLLDYPELTLSDQGIPEPAQAAELVNVILKFPDRTVENILHGWIEAHDYRFIGLLMDQLPDREIWEDRIQEAFRSDTALLETQELDRTIVMIEQALLDGLISENEHTDYKSKVESIRKTFVQKNWNEVQFVSIKKMYLRLESIRSELVGKREDRLASLRGHWNETKQNLPRITHNDQALISQIVSVIESSLKEKDLRVAGEYLSHLDAVFSGNRDLTISLFELQARDEKDVLADFQLYLPTIADMLNESRSHMTLSQIRDAILKDQAIGNYSLPPNFPTPRRQEASRAIDAWRKLKARGLENEEQVNLPLVKTLMEYLGFTFSNPSPVSINSIPEAASNFSHWRVAGSTGDFSPVAQFGSQRNGRYDVIGVWERPGIDVISSQVSNLMKKTGNQPTLLFYFGRLMPMQRKELLSITHRENLPMIVIDEIMIFFLARQYGTRLLPNFLCTLPYASLNPYFPAAAGLVPPEVFKGRRESVEKLIDPFGPAIVFGGRQLGKSALLRMVQREFHQPQNGQYAIYEDIRSVGDPVSGKNYKEDLLERLNQAFIKAKLSNLPRSLGDFDRLMNHVQQVLIEKDLKMILLLDEADHFLDADAEKNFALVQKLKNLMDQSGKRFKIVIAGLHNVQRFQRMSNQPLAHLGVPIEIGPLEPEAARELLMEPMHALGYRFGEDPKSEDISLVLHILSYTNYHPGLIQLFGNYLVEHLRLKYQRPISPPLSITRGDVEAVYRKKEVRDAIRDRFNWTLALDPRYEVIMLALILEQWEDQNGFDRRYTSRQLRDIASSWWSGAFDDESSFKGFLEELRGLGVLAAVDDGSRYRLRSPNLVYLMGTYDEIADRMESIVSGLPPGEHALESSRALLDSYSYSPLTFAQEQILNFQQPNVGLIIGCPASGLRLMDQAIQRLKPETGEFRDIRIQAQNGMAIKQQLDRFVNENRSANYLLALREIGGYPEELRDQINTALRYCRQARGRVLRIYFTMDAQSAWQWFDLPRDIREEIEDQVGVVMTLNRWDKAGIKQRIEKQLWNEIEVQPTEILLKKILEATYGWPYLVEELFSGFFDGHDPLRSVEEFTRAMDAGETNLARNFISEIGIYDDLPRKVILALLKDEIAAAVRSEPNYADYLQIEIQDVDIEKLENAFLYLKRLGVVMADNGLDPIIARLWNHA